MFSSDAILLPLEDTETSCISIYISFKYIYHLGCNYFSGLQIMEFVKESHYQLACTRYYELTHGVLSSNCDVLFEVCLKV